MIIIILSNLFSKRIGS